MHWQAENSLYTRSGTFCVLLCHESVLFANVVSLITYKMRTLNDLCLFLIAMKRSMNYYKDFVKLKRCLHISSHDDTVQYDPKIKCLKLAARAAQCTPHISNSITGSIFGVLTYVMHAYVISQCIKKALAKLDLRPRQNVPIKSPVFNV